MLITEQYVNLNHARAEQEVGGMTVGHNVGHETLESYLAALASPNSVAPTAPGATSYDREAYKNAHNAAIALDHTYDHSVVYSYNPQTREYIVEKTVIINGIQLPFTNKKVIYQKPPR